MIGRTRVKSEQWRVKSLIGQNPVSKGQRPKDKRQTGFSLLELLIAMFILIILLSVAIPTYQTTIQHAREAVLAENLYQMRRAIEQYTSDKGKAPQDLEDLKDADYLRELPTDPITEKKEWDPIMGDDPNSTEGEQGLIDVKSKADGEDSKGKAYKDY